MGLKDTNKVATKREWNVMGELIHTIAFVGRAIKEVSCEKRVKEEMLFHHLWAFLN